MSLEGRDFEHKQDSISSFIIPDKLMWIDQNICKVGSFVLENCISHIGKEFGRNWRIRKIVDIFCGPVGESIGI